MPQSPFRLVTRSDFDGLVCAVLLRHLDLIDEIQFVHPKDMQDGKTEVSSRDITTNLPYREEVHMCFDHHLSETLRLPEAKQNHIIDPEAPSAARVVWEHYGGHDIFPTAWDEMMDAVDKADSAQFQMHEIIEPTGWVLLNFLMDARTGLGRFRNFRISNYQLMMDLIEHCRTMRIDDILALPDVQERVALYRAQDELYRVQVKRCISIHDTLVVLDLRNEETIYSSNRFMIYAMHPGCTISMHVINGFRNQNTVFAVGKSILNLNNHTNIGELMLEFSGGGHLNAGTCQVDNDRAESTRVTLISRIVEEHQQEQRQSA
ncbi:MAG: nanoRNase/pAp phosphatase (c-di-AMP/oligoRNAs hydrolase) [Gammaproteobacteria bacterium]|jgi:nanoRNase/pAp phosphatase (c-di-AMP/oligoRNAs hydrolase)